MKGYYASGILFLAVYMVSARKLGSSYVVMHFIALGIAWPQLIGRLISQQRTGLSVVQLQPGKSVTLSAMIGIIFMIWMTSLFMLPNLRTYPEGIPIYDASYVGSRFSFLLMTIPTMVLFFMIAIQRIIIHVDGVSINGNLWAWSDFQGYEWKEHNNQKSVAQLLLKSKSKTQIKLLIPVTNKQQVEDVLVKNLKS